MISNPMDVLTAYPVRKTKSQKQLFRRDVTNYLQSLGYSVKEEKGSFGCVNVVAGDPEKAKFLVTAHYDTCAGMPFPNLITPCNFLPFALYQGFLLLIMFAFMGLGGVVAYLLTQNELVTFWIAYGCLWLFLILMMFGPANPSNANDNTSGVVTVLEMAKSIPAEVRDKVCFVLFDLEEAGLIGSASYRKTHKKASEHQIVLNLDCVGDGDDLVFFPTGKLKKDPERSALLENIAGTVGEKTITVHKKGFSYYPSDQANFPYGVGIAALRKSKLGLYLGRIHTKRDTILDENNVMLLRSRLILMISSMK